MELAFSLIIATRPIAIKLDDGPAAYVQLHKPIKRKRTKADYTKYAIFANNVVGTINNGLQIYWNLKNFRVGRF